MTGSAETISVWAQLRHVPPGGRPHTTPGGPAHRHRSRRFGGSSRQTPAQARTFARDILTAWNTTPTAINDAALIVSELATNAITHTLSVDVSVHLHQVGSVLTITVVDHGPHRPIQPRHAAPEAEHGRGLQTVTAVADKWGRHPFDPGTAVWARLCLPLPVGDEVSGHSALDATSRPRPATP